MMDEKQILRKLETAIILFATSLQDIMEKSNDSLAEEITKKAEENPDMTVDEMAKEIAKHVVAELSKTYGL
jgi:hypothetical protein